MTNANAKPAKRRFCLMARTGRRTYTPSGEYAAKIKCGHDYREARDLASTPQYTDSERATEVWVPVPDSACPPCPLEASNLGRLRDPATRRVLSIGVNHAGYPIAMLPSGAKPRTVAVAPMVWAAYNPSVVRGDNDIIYVDGDKCNSRPANLALAAHVRASRRANASPILIGDTVYPGASAAAEALGVTHPTIVRWAKRGCTTDGEPIRYAPEYKSAMDGMTVRI